VELAVLAVFAKALWISSEWCIKTELKRSKYRVLPTITLPSSLPNLSSLNMVSPLEALFSFSGVFLSALPIIKLMDTTHAFMMQRCLQLALQGTGKTHPNPMVGCVVLDATGQVVGEGFHPYIGGPHAEVVALDQAGEKARGGTLYVNLEPCNHHGKTPPCSQRVVASGVKTVYYGMQDPNPKVAGSGVETLKAAGIEVISGVLEAESQKLNEAFSHYIQTRQPFVVLKQALTLDAKIATRSGESQWITCPKARQWVHQLRGQSDAILTTAQTVMQDNSRLTVRDVPLPGRPPTRIVLDRRATLNPREYALFQMEEQSGAVWMVTQKGQGRHSNLVVARAMGVQVFEVDAVGTGLDLNQVIVLLGQQQVTQLLVEAGGHLAGALLQAGLIQKLRLMYGNKLLMDNAALSAFVGEPLFRLQDALSLTLTSTQLLGDSLLLEAYPKLCNSNFLK